MRKNTGAPWTAIGLMSGTSADGITAAVIRWTRGTLRLLSIQTVSYPRSFRTRLLSASSASSETAGCLSMELGKLLAQAARTAMQRAGLSPDEIDVIGSHGHTVGHGPRARVPWTLQIGEPSVIAEETGVTTVADFRPRDIAAGGEGAPLVPYLDRVLFGSGPAVAVQNIGGIANVTVVGRSVRTPIAFDTGPGNCLVDLAAAEITRERERLDRGGRLAARGMPDKILVRRMLSHPYFSLRPPKSTGRDLFSRAFLPLRLVRMFRSRPADAMATLAMVTAQSIADAYRRFVLPKYSLSRVVVSGGGVYNRTLMNYLRECLYPIPVVPSMEYGIHPMAREAMAFALMAIEAVRGRTNNVPSATGARHEVILGKIVPGKRFRGVIRR